MAANVDPTFELTTHEGIVVTAKVSGPAIVLEAEEEKLAFVWSLRFEDKDTPVLTSHICNRSHQVIHLLSAAKSQRGFTLSVQKQNSLKDKTIQEIAVLVTKKQEDWEDKKSFTLLLNPVEMDPVDRVARIAHRNVTTLGQLLKTEGECFDPRFCHSNLILSQNNRALTMSGSDVHSVCTTGVPYASGKHYFAVRIIRSAAHHVFCGVCKESGEGGVVGYSGSGLDGHSFYSNGNVHPGVSGYDRGTAPSGSTVGVFLDLDEKIVRYDVNGWAGAEFPLRDGPYYFYCSLHTKFDAIELLPELCWHK